MRMHRWALSFLFLLNVLPASARTYIDGADSSGGGLAVVCRHPDDSIKSVQMLDLFDAAAYGLKIVDPGFDVNGNLAVIEKKLKTIFTGVKDKKSPDTLIAKALKDFTLLPVNVQLEPVNDGSPDFLPKFCKIEQAALYKNNKQLFVDRELWNQMNDLNKAALIVHEAVYLHERELGDVTSKRSRKLVAYLFSDYLFESLMVSIPTDANNCIAHPQNNLGEIAFEFYKYKDPLVADQEILQFTKFRGRYPYSLTRVYTPLWPWQGIDEDYFDVDSPIEVFDQLYLRKDKVSLTGGYYIHEKGGKYLIKCNNSLDSAKPAILKINGSVAYNFGSVPVSQTAYAELTVFNAGESAAQNMMGVGLSAPFSFRGAVYPGVGGTCGSSLSAGARCTVIVSFNPMASSVYSDNIELQYFDGLNSSMALGEIQGTGLTPASLSISDGPTYDFGTFAIGSSDSKVFTITNSGASTAVKMTGGGLAAPYAFKGGVYPGAGGTCGASLVGGGTTCTIVVTYNPTKIATHNDAIDIAYNDGASAQTATRDVTGTGVAPASLVISDGPTYDFGTQAVGSSTNKTFTVVNSGGFQASALAGSGLAEPYRFFGGGYPGIGGTCGAILNPGAACTVVISYAPISVGASSDMIVINYFNGVTSTQTTRTVSGTAALPAGLVISDGPSYDYGAVATGSSNDHTFTVTNSGAVSALSVGGSGLAAPFSFKGGSYPGTGGTCGQTIGAAASCTIVVTYAPTATGIQTDVIEIWYFNGSAQTNSTRDIQGTSTNSAVIAISDTDPYDFGSLAAGASGDHPFVLSNIGGTTATGMTGKGLKAPFSFKGGSYPGTGGTCTYQLAPGKDCTVIVSFNPPSSGAYSGTLRISYTDGVTEQISSRDVTGNGTAPALLSISNGPTYDFGHVANGGIVSKAFTVTNSGAVTATVITEIGLSAPFAFSGGKFPGVGGTCGSSIVGWGATCTIVVEFAPVGLGVFADTIVLSYNNGSQREESRRQIQGTGAAPASLTISDGPTYDFGKVAKGNHRTKTFTVTNGGAITAFGMVGAGLSSPFSFLGGSYPGTGGTCGVSLAAAGTCTVVVGFDAKSAGSFSDTLEIQYNNGAKETLTTRELLAEVVAPAKLVITEPFGDGYDFGKVAVGKKREISLTLENKGFSTAQNIKIASGLNHPFQFKGGDYPGDGGTCGEELLAQTTCEMVLEFVPTVQDTFVDSIGIFYNDGISKPVVVYYLNGEGV